MKITKKKLENIIKQELQTLLENPQAPHPSQIEKSEEDLLNDIAQAKADIQTVAGKFIQLTKIEIGSAREVAEYNQLARQRVKALQKAISILDRLR